MSAILNVGIMSSYSMEDETPKEEITLESLTAEMEKTSDSLYAQLEGEVTREEVEARVKDQVSQEGFANLVVSVISTIVKIIINLIAAVAKMIAGFLIYITKKVAGFEDTAGAMKGSKDNLSSAFKALGEVSMEDDSSSGMVTVEGLKCSGASKSESTLINMQLIESEDVRSLAYLDKIRKESTVHITKLESAITGVMKDIVKSKDEEAIARSMSSGIGTLFKTMGDKTLKSLVQENSTRADTTKAISTLIGVTRVRKPTVCYVADLPKVIDMMESRIESSKRYSTAVVKSTEDLKKSNHSYEKKVRAFSKHLVLLDSKFPNFKKNNSGVEGRFRATTVEAQRLLAKLNTVSASQISVSMDLLNKNSTHLKEYADKLTQQYTTNYLKG